MDPVSLIAIVPVALCNWPTVTTVSVTARAREPLRAGSFAAIAALAVPSMALFSLLQPRRGLARSKDRPQMALAIPLIVRAAVLCGLWRLSHVIFSTFRRRCSGVSGGGRAGAALGATGCLGLRPELST